MMKEIVKGMWQFARFLFVPRRRPFADAEG